MKMTIKAGNLKEVIKELNKNAKQAEKVLTATGRDLYRRVPGRVADDVRAVYNIKKSAITPTSKADAKKGTRKAGSVRVKGVTVSDVSIVYKGRLLSISRFGMTPRTPAEQSKGKRVHRRRKVKAMVKRGGKKVVHSQAFLGHTGARTSDKTQFIAWKRTGPGRYPIEPIRSVSLPQMISNESVREKINSDINEMLQKRLANNIKRFIK